MECNGDALGKRELPSNSITATGELVGHSLTLPLLFVPESGLKVSIVWWCCPCQGHESEAIPAVSRRHPLELSLNWEYPGMDGFSYQNGDRRRTPTSLSGCLLIFLIFPLKIMRLLSRNVLGASSDRIPFACFSLFLLHRLLW